MDSTFELGSAQMFIRNLDRMVNQLKNSGKKLIQKYREGGLLSVFQAVRWYIPHSIHKMCRNSRLMKGDRQFSIYTNLRYRFHNVRYKAPGNPWKVIFVNPQNIEFSAKPVRHEWGLGRLSGGDWDSSDLEPIETNIIVQGLYQRFELNYDWEETIYVKELDRQYFCQNKSKWGYADLDTFIEVRCNYIDILYQKIKSSGYRPNYVGNHEVPETDVRSDDERFAQKLEPLVAIGREGEIYIADGYHRFAIARLLELDSIPFNILCRHQQWQELRDDIYHNDLTEEHDLELRNHPDLQDIINK